MGITGKTVVYLCPGCGTQGTQLVTASGTDGLSVVCPACGSRVMSRELASGPDKELAAGV